MAETTSKSTGLNNKIYDKLKTTALIVLPALATLYFLLSQIWDLPAPDKVIGTIVALDTVLGGSLKYSSRRYYKSGKNFDGEINFIELEDGDERVRFDINQDPIDVIHDEPGKHSFEFRVNKLREGSNDS